MDDLLEGGLTVGKIYEITGLPCGGKSKLAQQLLATIFKNSGKGGWYFDI